MIDAVLILWLNICLVIQKFLVFIMILFEIFYVKIVLVEWNILLSWIQALYMIFLIYFFVIKIVFLLIFNWFVLLFYLFKILINFFWDIVFEKLANSFQIFFCEIFELILIIEFKILFKKFFKLIIIKLIIKLFFSVLFQILIKVFFRLILFNINCLIELIIHPVNIKLIF